MSSQQHTNLCSLLVKENFGRVSSHIFSTVALHGSLKRVAIAEVTGIHGQQLKAILALLTQQHLLLHFVSEDNQTEYKVHPRGAYEVFRFHRLIALVHERYGEAAASLVSHINLLGQCSVGNLSKVFKAIKAVAVSKGQLETEYQESQAHANGTKNAFAGPQSDSVPTANAEPGTDGELGTDADLVIKSSAHLHQLLRSLLRAGFLVKSTKRDHIPAADLEEAIADLVKNDMPDRKVTGPKKQAEFAIRIAQLKRQWRKEDEYNDERDTEPGQPAKRVKGNGELANGVNHQEKDAASGLQGSAFRQLPAELVLRVNMAKVRQCLRNSYLEQLAHKYLGDTTAAVYRALLQVLETRKLVQHHNTSKSTSIEKDSSDEEGEGALLAASTSEVSEKLDLSLDLTDSIKGAAELYGLYNGDARKAKRARRGVEEDFSELGIKREEESESDIEQPSNGLSVYEARNKRLQLVEDHLCLLEEHSKGFCKRTKAGGRSSWHVDLPTLTRTSIQSEIDATVLSRFGSIHMRIARMLRDRGKLEEKQVAALTMMRVKDVRAIMTEMQYAGFVREQEVPRDAHRQASRNIYLWFWEDDNVKDLVEQTTYDSMRHTIERLETERLKYRAVIEKSEMMKGRQQQLGQNDRDLLEQWREIETKLVNQARRMDELIAIIH